MKIVINKSSPYRSDYRLIKKQTEEQFSLETKTYFLHDICHFVVENNLAFTKGFWGMLSDGFTIDTLFGKTNPHTASLRLIEQIVGPVQSTYLGHTAVQNFADLIQHVDFDCTALDVNKCIKEIDAIMQHWQTLPLGQSITLTWDF